MDKSLMLNKIKQHLNIAAEKDFAIFLGIKPTNLAMWHKRNTFDIELLFKKCEWINPEWLLTGNGNMLKEPKGNTANELPTEYSGRKNIAMIDVKAAAGLPGNLHNPVFYSEFPTFTLPGKKYQMGRFICLQIGGDSMHPTVKNNEWVIGQEMEDLNIKNGYVYLVVTLDSVLCKRLYKKKNSDYIELISDNDEVYTAQQLHKSEIKRIYEASEKITNDFRNWNSDVRRDIAELRSEFAELKREFRAGK